MKTTDRNSIPYPEQGDSPNEATAMANLVGQIDRRMVPRFASAADRTSRVPSPSTGMYGYRTDVHRFEIYRDSAWQPAAFSRTVVKQTATARTLTTTPTADPELQIDQIYSGRTYLVEVVAIFLGDSGVDLKHNFGGPTISSGSVFWWMAPTTVSTITATEVSYGSLTEASMPTTQLQAGAVSSSQESVLLFRGFFIPSANGTFTWNWSQVVSSALPTEVKAGSYMTVTMLA